MYMMCRPDSAPLRAEVGKLLATKASTEQTCICRTLSRVDVTLPPYERSTYGTLTKRHDNLVVRDTVHTRASVTQNGNM